MIVSLLLAALVVLGIYVGSHRLSGSQVAVVLLLGVVGLIMVVSPDIASFLASRLGVGRGTDLLLYFAIIGGLFITANLYFRSKRLEERIVILTREIALSAPKTSSEISPISHDGGGLENKVQRPGSLV